MTMKNPPHPGLSVRHDCIEPLDLTITEAANILGVTRQALNNLVNGKSGISPEMAIRLDKAFGGGAETWLRLQMAYDLAQCAATHAGHPFGRPNGLHSGTEHDVVGVLRSCPHGGAGQRNARGVSPRLEQCLD